MRKHELLIDLLILSGLALIGAGVTLAFGVAAVLAYAGAALLVVGVALALRQAQGPEGRR